MKEKSGVNVSDLFWALCQKWRIFVLVTCVFALFGCVYSWQNSKQKMIAEQQVESVEDIKLDDYAMQRVRLYLSTEKGFEKQSYYNENSLLMSLDPSKVVIGKLVYQCSKGDAQLYRDSLKTQELLDQIAEELQIEDVQKKYVGELIEANNEITVVSKDDNTSTERVLNDNSVCITVYQNTEEECKAILHAAEKRMQQIQNQLQKNNEEHVLNCICKEVVITTSEDLAQYQEVNLKRQKDYQEYIYNVQKFFTPSEEIYVNIYHKQMLDENGENVQQEEVKVTFSKKIIILSGLFGIVLTAFFYLFLYLFNTRLQQEDNLTELLGVKVLGIVRTKKKRFSVFAFVDRFFEVQRNSNLRILQSMEDMSMIGTQLQIMTESLENKEIYCSCDGNMYQIEKCMSQLANEMKELGITLHYGKSITEDANALRKSADCRQVVLVVQIDKTKYFDIQSVLTQCEQYGLNVLGVIELQ